MCFAAAVLMNYFLAVTHELIDKVLFHMSRTITNVHAKTTFRTTGLHADDAFIPLKLVI